jgi:hypothetical protein
VEIGPGARLTGCLRIIRLFRSRPRLADVWADLLQFEPDGEPARERAAVAGVQKTKSCQPEPAMI